MGIMFEAEIAACAERGTDLKGCKGHREWQKVYEPANEGLRFFPEYQYRHFKNSIFLW